MRNNSPRKKWFTCFFKKYIVDIVLCSLSAFCIFLSFVFPGLWFLPWIALIPFLKAIEEKDMQVSFALGYLFGIVFFFMTLSWLFCVTKWFSVVAAVGVVSMLLYLSSYFALFAVFYNIFQKHSAAVKIFLIPCLWVSLEYLRATLFTGFSWVSLGLSQYKVLPIIQIADITGMFGVSFLIVMVNVAIKEMFSVRGLKKILISIFPMSILALSLLYGYSSLNQDVPTEKILVSVIQANIKQDDKWDYSLFDSNLKRHISLTEQALLSKTQLVVWPETALQGIFDEDNILLKNFQEFSSKINVPIVTGMVTSKEEKFYNTALLFSGSKGVVGSYDKIHLVPFGEYVPFRKYFPSISLLIPIEDFTSGKRFKVFDIGEILNKENSVKFSTLICFEDTVPDIVRKFVLNGADFFINITNDAWFPSSNAPFLHLQSSVFRAVENNRSLVRAANTGVSGIIDNRGRIKGFVSNGKRQMTEISGYLTSEVPLAKQITLYTKLGDVFTYLCFGCILIFISINMFLSSKRISG